MKITFSLITLIILSGFQAKSQTNLQEDKCKSLAKQCTSCHIKSSNKSDSGLTNIRKVRTLDWIYNFTRNPFEFSKVNSDARKILQKYGGVLMTSFTSMSKIN
jgi:hypothetical protein